jgi:hypothetical protein
MFFKKNILWSSLLLLTINAHASNSESSIYNDIDAGSVSKINDVKTPKASDGNQYSVLNKSFYIDMKSKVGMPNLKLEYTNNAYSTRFSNLPNNYMNNDSNLVDMDLQYGDVVSYYTLFSPYTSFGMNVGAGLRQYIGDFEYRTDNVIEKESLNSTIPLSYIDMFYEVSENSAYIGIYNKESQLNKDKIKEAGVYYKKRISGIDNLNFTASYSLSNISFSKAYNAHDYSGAETSGLNLQMKFTY